MDRHPERMAEDPSEVAVGKSALLSKLSECDSPIRAATQDLFNLPAIRWTQAA